MFCCVCHNDLADCTCPDLEERLANINSPHVGLTYCQGYGRYKDLCNCANPDWKMRIGTGTQEVNDG